MEDVLKLLDHYGLPLVALFLVWSTLAPILKQIAKKHIEAIDALQANSAATAGAVQKIVDLIGRFGTESMKAHEVTHSRIAEVDERLGVIARARGIAVPVQKTKPG